MTGRVNSIQSLAAVDGPGVRFAVFLQGCHLRCGCCHNPDTWSMDGGEEYTPNEIVDRAERYREYFGNEGGITLSGGEPLLQADFTCEVFRICRERSINTCLDTSGAVPLTESVKNVLRYTDTVLLDVKYVTDELYQAHVGCEIARPLAFLDYLNGEKIPTVIRQVTIPGLNSDADSVAALRDLAAAYECVRKVELLPFHKLCREKYERLGIEFPFDSYREPTPENMAELNELLTK